MNQKSYHSAKTPDEPATSRRRFLKTGAAAAGVALLGDALGATAVLAAK